MKQTIDTILAHSSADATEVLVFANDSQLTRFANSAVHQNVAEKELLVQVRAIVGRRQGVATTNDMRPEALTRVLDQAVQAARLQPERETAIPLAGPAVVEPLDAFDAATAGCSPRRRAEAVGLVCRLSQERGLNASGAFSTAAWSIAIGNSLGLFQQVAGTRASFTTVVMGADSSGFAESAAWSVDQLDTEALGREAIETALRSRAPRSVAAGEYPVVLRPYAVADMLGTLGYIGFGALGVQEGRSFMTGQIGKQLAAPLVTIWDDGRDRRGLPMAVDYEGVPRQKVLLLEAGVARGVVYDLETAAKEGRASTGHGLPAPNTYGPMPQHLFMAAGTATLDELIGSVQRGLLVTRFHYTVPVHEKQTVTTGMTRDGTFWIEDGQIAYPVKNLRFTQNYIAALNGVELLGRETRLMKDGAGGINAPAVKMGAFRFTGVTEF